MSNDDAEAIKEIIDDGAWIEATPNCVMNCSINLNGRLYYYSSDCGTLEELDVSKMSYLSAKVQEVNNKSLKLSDTQKDVMNAILEKYISLDLDMDPVDAVPAETISQTDVQEIALNEPNYPQDW